MSSQKLSIVLKALANLGNLKVLDFSFCSLSDDAGKVLKEFLKINASLEHLEIQGNRLAAPSERIPSSVIGFLASPMRKRYIFHFFKQRLKCVNYTQIL